MYYNYLIGNNPKAGDIKFLYTYFFKFMHKRTSEVFTMIEDHASANGGRKELSKLIFRGTHCGSKKQPE